MKRNKLLLMTLFAGLGFYQTEAQNIAEIAKSDPLIITGAVGTQNTYYHSSAGNGMMNPMSNSVYANLNFSVYGINMPFSFYYSNSGSSFSYPHFSFDISPSYKDWTLHIGRRSMPFSNYVFNIPFYGVGIEYNDRVRKLRFGAFYGQLKKSINDDPTDPSARNPQYERRGWGIKVGYGTGRNYVDLYFLRAKDRLASLDDRWYDRIQPQENIAIGLKGRLSLGQHFSLSTNVATSIFSTDVTSQLLETREASKWENLFDTRYSSLYRFAGDLTANLSFSGLNIMASYKMIQPDYMTLGSNYVSNNLQSLGLAANTSLLKHKLSLNGQFSAQEDNLSGEQLYTTRGFVYSASANYVFTEKLSLNAAYNGYLQRQYDGSAVVNDTTRVNRVMNSFTVTPNYNFGSRIYGQNIGVSYNYSENTDLNEYNEHDTDVTTHALGLNYGLNCTPIETAFSASYNYQSSETKSSSFKTNAFSVGATRAFLKERTLTASLNMTVSLNEMQKQQTMSYGLNSGVAYTLRKVHQFTFSTAVNKYNDYYLAENNSYSGFDYTVSLNYNYTFTLLSLKRKVEDDASAKSAGTDKKKKANNKSNQNAIDQKRLFK